MPRGPRLSGRLLRRQRPWLRAAALLGALVVPACGPDAVTVVGAPPAPPAGCAPLLAALPPRLGGLAPRQVSPAGVSARAWGSPAVVLRCGVGVPAAARTATAQYLTVDGLDWFEVDGPDAIGWTTPLRTPAVSLTVPRRYTDQTGVLGQATAVVLAHTAAAR